MKKTDALNLAVHDEVTIKSRATNSGGAEYGLIKNISTQKDFRDREIIVFDILLHTGEYLKTISHKDIL